MSDGRIAYPRYSAMALGVAALALFAACLMPPTASGTENADLPSSNPTATAVMPIDPGERDCLAEAVYFEARSEPRDGRIAVAHVVLNRAASEGHPDRVCEVIREGEGRGRGRCQFSWRCDGLADTPRDMTAWAGAKAVAEEVMRGRHQDPTGGALFYHAASVNPHWAPKLQRVAQIGSHIFYLR